MTATTNWSLPSSRLAFAMPSAQDSEVDAWEFSTQSCGDSARLGYPERPPGCRSVGNMSLRPVRILWT